MEITEAPEIPATEEVPVESVQLEVTEGLEQEITKDIETGKKPKKPRTEAQKAAFMKAREALAEKRKAAAEEKASKKKKPGRPPKVKEAVGGSVQCAPGPFPAGVGGAVRRYNGIVHGSNRGFVPKRSQ